MRFHASGHTSLVEILKRSDGSRSRGRAFEDVFQIVIMVEVETTNGQDLLRTLHLALDEAVFSAGVGPQCQATVAPQLPLGAETVGCLQDRNQQGGADRTNRGNLPQ